MVETITYTIGFARDEKGFRRRENLLNVSHKVEKENYFEVSFQYVEHTEKGVKQVNLNYQILK